MTVTLRRAGRRRIAGFRVENVVIAHAVLLEIALVVTRGHDREVMHRNGGDGVCGVVRVGNADVPVLALVRADGVDVAAKDEQPVRVRAFQNIRAEVCGVALCDAAEVDF